MNYMNNMIDMLIVCENYYPNNSYDINYLITHKKFSDKFTDLINY